MQHVKKAVLTSIAGCLLSTAAVFGMGEENSKKSPEWPIQLRQSTVLNIAGLVYDHPLVSVFVPFWVWCKMTECRPEHSLTNKSRLAVLAANAGFFVAPFVGVVALKAGAHHIIADKLEHDHDGWLFDYKNLLKRDSCRPITPREKTPVKI